MRELLRSRLGETVNIYLPNDLKIIGRLEEVVFEGGDDYVVAIDVEENSMFVVASDQIIAVAFTLDASLDVKDQRGSIKATS